MTDKFAIYNLEKHNSHWVEEKNAPFDKLLFDSIEEAKAFKNEPDLTKMYNGVGEQINTENWVIVLIEGE